MVWSPVSPSSLLNRSADAPRECRCTRSRRFGCCSTKVCIAQDGARYVMTGDVTDLEVPETLHALVAARLDNLDAAERALLQDAAVIGQSFTLTTLSAVVTRPAADVERLLDGLVAKQVLGFIDDLASGRTRPVCVPAGVAEASRARHTLAP